VLIGGADARHFDLHEQRPVRECRPREFLHLVTTWSHQHCRSNSVSHLTPPFA
jgi:hypothetical protein